MQNSIEKEWWCIDLGQAIHHSPLKLQQLAEGFLRFTPDVVIGKNRIFMEMSRTKKCLGLDSIRMRSAVIALREEVDAEFWQWGVGRTIPEAWVQCRWKSFQSTHLPIDALFDYVDPLSHSVLTRNHHEKISLFMALGMRTLDDLFQIPHDALLVRFGEMLDQFSKNYFDGARFPWRPFQSTLELIEESKWNAEDWTSDAETLIFRIKPLVDRLMSRLFSLKRSLVKLELTLKLDSNAPDRKFAFSFVFPQTSSQLLLKIVRERLSLEMEKNPLADPISQCVIEVKETVIRDQSSLSFAFSEKEEVSSEDLREKWLELISYLGTAFQVETTEELLPERSWKKVLCAKPGVSDSLDRVSHLYPKRPFKLYPAPIALARVGMYLKKNQELWKIRDFKCEEKLSGHEWDVDDTQNFDRTYYRVKVETDKNGGDHREEWWVYKDELLHKLMLHGVYS